jgi:hypothetical protein
MSAENPRSSSLRMIILFAVLILMLLALGYDYRVARPKVDEAEAAVEKLNKQINESAEARVMSNVDVQEALNRKPSKTFTEGPYTVEQFSWMSGLPFRSYSYFALYRPAGDELSFQMHFKHKLPPDIGKVLGSDQEEAGTEAEIMGPDDTAEHSTVDQDEPGPSEEPGEEIASEMEPAEVDTSPEESPEEKSSEKPAEEKPSEKPAGEEAADKPAEEKPSEKPAEEKPAEKPAEEKPAEKPAEG